MSNEEIKKSKRKKNSDIDAILDEGTSVNRKTFRPNSNVSIIVDSCGDFDPKIADALGVEVIGFPYRLSDKEYIDDMFQTVSAHEFYNAMRKGAAPTTSAVTPGRYLEIFTKYAKVGKPTLYLAFTAGLSSSIESARQAAELLKKDYPKFELYIIDNTCPALAAELLTIEVVKQANKQKSASDLAKWTEEAKYYVHGLFTIEDLDVLARGGRIPAAAANLGGKLDIKPELSFDEQGALTLKRMCRGRKKALKALVGDFLAESDGVRDMPIGIGTADADKDGDALQNMLAKDAGCEGIPFFRSTVSPIIGSHVGPDMVAIVFWGKDRRVHDSITDKISNKVSQMMNK